MVVGQGKQDVADGCEGRVPPSGLEVLRGGDEHAGSCAVRAGPVHGLRDAGQGGLRQMGRRQGRQPAAQRCGAGRALGGMGL